jgi:hypothetical protein
VTGVAPDPRLRDPDARAGWPPPFSEAEGAGGHIGGLGQQVWNGFVFDWLDTVLSR